MSSVNSSDGSFETLSSSQAWFDLNQGGRLSRLPGFFLLLLLGSRSCITSQEDSMRVIFSSWKELDTD